VWRDVAAGLPRQNSDDFSTRWQIKAAATAPFHLPYVSAEVGRFIRADEIFCACKYPYEAAREYSVLAKKESGFMSALSTSELRGS
jgi:hypothetical protein